MGKLSKDQQMLIVVVVCFLGGVYLYWNNLLKPTREKIKVNESKYQDLLVKIDNAEKQSRRLPALQSEKAILEQDVASLEKQLPKDKDVPNIIRTLTREAIQENLVFSNLAPKQPTKQQYFEVIPFDLKFNGTLQSLARFLASLGQQERIFQAQNIQLTPSGGQSENAGFVPLSISLTIQTYAYSG